LIKEGEQDKIERVCRDTEDGERTAMAMIRTQDLVKVYPGGVRAVDGVSFEVQKGEIFGFLGPNGAGKTTTIKVLVTLLRPTSGQAEVAGYDVSKYHREVRNRIGYVGQDVGIDELATGGENLRLYGHLYRLDDRTIKSRIEELMALVELTGYEDKRVSTYSGGMRKRLDIAMGLIHRPEVLILDEPTVGLDPQTRAHIREYVRNLSKQDGVTIFFTTHYMEEADIMADRIAIIDYGRIVALGTPEELKDEISGDVVTISLDMERPEETDRAMLQSSDTLKELQFVREIQRRDSDLNVYVDDGEHALPQLMRTLEGQGIMVKAISLARPSLDDVFLKHTGRTIREEEGKRTSFGQIERMRRRRPS